jgi:hypothetical protein
MLCCVDFTFRLLRGDDIIAAVLAVAVGCWSCSRLSSGLLRLLLLLTWCCCSFKAATAAVWSTGLAGLEADDDLRVARFDAGVACSS